MGIAEEKVNIKSLSREERAAQLKAMGLPGFREKQIFRWICRGAESFDQCTDLPLSLRRGLSERYSWENLEAEHVQKSCDGTKKILLRLTDGNRVESVFMEYEYGNSLCISTQVGCSMGCSFCASTIGGKVRNLKAWEMLDEYIFCRKEAEAPINHLVLMGMGEPLDNYDEVGAFLRLIHDSEGINLSYRNITVSTCGLVPGILRLGDDFPRVNLAVSLHCASQAEREKLMPVAGAYGMNELISACKTHIKKTGRRVSFEFALIKGVNDKIENAQALAKLLRGMICHVNLIPLNPVEGSRMQGADRRSAEIFRRKLEDLGIPATVRRQLGADIDAACGQLRKKYTQAPLPKSMEQDIIKAQSGNKHLQHQQ